MSVFYKREIGMSDFTSVILYLFVASSSTFFFDLYKNEKKMIKYGGMSLSILIPAFFAGIRYNVGTDYSNYFWTFNQLEKVSINWIISDADHFNIDRGFLIFSKLLNFGGNTRYLFGIWGAIILTIFVHTLYSQYRKYDITVIYFAFIFLYYYYSFNILRQSIAITIVFGALKYIFSNHPVKYLTCVLLASTIHFSALLALPIWFLWNHKLAENLFFLKRGILFGIIVIVVGLWQPILMQITHFNISAILKYTGYLERTNHLNMSFFVKLILLFFFIVLQTRFQIKDKQLDFFVSLFTISMLIDYTGFYSAFVKRISAYYSISEIVLLGEVSSVFTIYSKQLCRWLVMLIIVLYFLLGALVLRQGGLIPFQI